MGSLSLLQGIFPTQGLNSGLPAALQADSSPAELPGKHKSARRVPELITQLKQSLPIQVIKNPGFGVMQIWDESGV